MVVEFSGALVDGSSVSMPAQRLVITELTLSAEEWLATRDDNDLWVLVRRDGTTARFARVRVITKGSE